MLSVIIPTLDSASTLAATLERTASADELIVADGGSRDRTAAIAQRAGARLLRCEPGRGRQLHCGAQAASGDWLLFLHADTFPGPGWRAAVAAHAATSRAAACFRFRLDDPAWQARLIERGVAARSSLLRLPYGDQGLLVPKRLYDEIGGYRPLPLMEDVDIVRRIGRRRLELLDEIAVTSAVRWRRDGWLRRSGRNLVCLGLYGIGVRPDRIARLYG